MVNQYLLFFCMLIVPAAALAQATLPPEVYAQPGPHVVVNGEYVNARAVNVEGRLLLPMRAVFETLQSDVQWTAATRQITATRGQTVVQLWIGRPYALIDGRQVALDVPPRLINSVTYVPLRFPAEAFGGDVRWEPSIQTAIITIPPVVPGVPSTTVTGTLLDVREGDARTLIMQQRTTNAVLAIPVTSTVVIRRAQAGAPLQQVAITALQLGDLLVITRDSSGRATRVDATYQQVSGRVSGITSTRLLLQDGSVYELRQDVRITDAAGNSVPLSSIQNGTEVTLRVTPGTSQVWAIVTGTLTPQPGTPAITSVGVVNYTRPLRAGEIVTIRVTGTPQADAVTARIGDALINIPLRETSPGVYQGQVTIPTNANATDVPIFARLRRGTVTSAEARSTQTVTLDTLPPVISNITPANNGQYADTRPLISATFDDRDGSGIDPQDVRVRVNGVDVTNSALISSTGFSYQSFDLPTGQQLVQVGVDDRAGNTRSVEWRFTVTTGGGSGSVQILSVQHNAAGITLQSGQSVTFTTQLSATPARIEWYLDNTLIATGGDRATTAQTYTRNYTVRSTDPSGSRTLSVRVYDAAGNSRQQSAFSPLVISTTTQTFGITGPANNARATDPLTVTGTAPSGSRVRVTVNYQGSVIFIPTSGQIYQNIVTANNARTWTTPAIRLSVPSLTDVNSYTVRAELLDAQGNVTQTDTVTLQAD